MSDTTDNSRADALTDAIWRLKRDLERGDVGMGTCLVYMADLRTLLAAVEQHEAAPTGYCERAGGCVCGGDLPRVRAGCSEWVSTKPQHEAARSEKRYNGSTAADLREICSTRPAHYPTAHHEFDKTILALLDDIEQPAPSAPLEGTGNGVDERTIEAVIAKATGKYRTGDSYTFEDVWNCIEVALSRAPRNEVAGAEMATPQPSFDERGEFEAWARENGYSIYGDPRVRDAYGGATQSAWRGWMGRSRLTDGRAVTLLRQARDELSLIEWENDPPNRVYALFGDIDKYVSGTPAQAMYGAAGPSADTAAEDKYVIERLSTVLTGVAAALLGEEADRPAAETLQKMPEEAAKLRLELDLYRAQAADAAAAPADERAAFKLSEGERDVLRALTKCLDDKLTQSEIQLLIRIANDAPAQARAAAAQPAADDSMTLNDAARQYRDGVHIGSGLPFSTCPCGLCEKVRGIGRTAAAAGQEAVEAASTKIHQVWMEETSSWADVTAAYYSERQPSNRRIVYYVAPAITAKPVAWRIFNGEGEYSYTDNVPPFLSVEWAAKYGRTYEPLYTAPPAQVATRQGLTDEQIDRFAREHLYVGDDDVVFGTENFAHAIERALLEGAKQ